MAFKPNKGYENDIVAVALVNDFTTVIPEMATKPYKHARFYYMDAYRERMKVVQPGWTGAQRHSTLNWMWSKVCTPTEAAACRQLCEQKSQNAFSGTDDASIPNTPKRASDPAPQPAGADVPAPEPVGTDDPVPEPAGADDPGAVVSEAETAVNNTKFPHMLPAAEMNDALPPLPWGKLTAAQKRTLLEAELDDPEAASDGKRWHGMHFLGQGSTGSCSLWIRTDQNGNIDHRLAVRDIATLSYDRWIHPIYWRDRLPREIAILRRLDEQQGYENSINRYHGHRISAHQRRYRVYNEVCDLGDLGDALDWYRKQWERRRNKFRWLDTHPEIERAREEGNHDFAEWLNQEAWGEYITAMNDRLDGRDNNSGVEFDEMSSIDKWHGEEVGSALPDVIPEAFLWQVFDQLVGACLTMQRGANPVIGPKAWKEIVHKDIHLGNILLKPAGHADLFGERLIGDNADAREPGFCYARFTKSNYPDIVLADFDTAFFDLQNNGDEYQDNPFHYLIGDKASDHGAGGRYPPELFSDYQNRNGLTKLTSATDVWGIGSIMWNLAMNLAGQWGNFDAPFFDDTGSNSVRQIGRKLVNGQPYDAAHLQLFVLTGDTPFEAPSQYSEALKEAIRRCLNYHPQDRIALEELKRVTEKNRKASLEHEDMAGELVVRYDGRMDGFKVGDRYIPKP